jgi:SnoaL-like domain
MTTQDRLLLQHALFELEARYWYDVDCNAGRKAHEFYLPDGLMVVGHNQFRGREKIREFYEWRERQAANAVSSVKTIRHLINNLYVESSTPGCAKVLGIVSFYGSVLPSPARQSRPPMLIADLINECVLDDDDNWRFRSHVLRPVFMSHEAPLSIAVDTRR